MPAVLGRTIAWQRQAPGRTRADGDVTVTRRRWHVLPRWAYPALALMVLLGLAAMHGGSAATPAGGHGLLAMSTHAVADSGHAAGAARQSADVGAAALSSARAQYGADHDGATAGCVLALTGILGLALVCLARRVARRPTHVMPVRSRWQAPYLRQRAGPAPIPGSPLCVLRT